VERNLTDNPLSLAAFERLLEKLQSSFPEEVGLNERDVLNRGYF
jgi:hypothetical protein